MRGAVRLATLDRALMPPAPASRLGVLRVIVGLYATIYLVARTPHLMSYANLADHAYAPVGVVSSKSSREE